MDDTRCVVCGAEVEAGQSACPKCGFNFVGKTESLEIPKAAVNKNTSIQESNGAPTLTITKGHLAGESFAISNFPLVIGRDPSCDLFLNNMTVSRKHAEIIEKDGVVFLEDLNSLNGTWLNGQIIDSIAPLNDGSLLQIGTFTMVFSYK